MTRRRRRRGLAACTRGGPTNVIPGGGVRPAIAGTTVNPARVPSALAAATAGTAATVGTPVGSLLGRDVGAVVGVVVGAAVGGRLDGMEVGTVVVGSFVGKPNVVTCGRATNINDGRVTPNKNDC